MRCFQANYCTKAHRTILFFGFNWCPKTELNYTIYSDHPKSTPSASWLNFYNFREIFNHHGLNPINRPHIILNIEVIAAWIETDARLEQAECSKGSHLCPRQIFRCRRALVSQARGWLRARGFARHNPRAAARNGVTSRPLKHRGHSMQT